MHFRRNNRRVAIDPSSELFTIEPVRGPMLIITAIMLAAGGGAVAIALNRYSGAEPWWGLGIVWALVAILFAGIALWPAPRLRVELQRSLLILDGATHSLGDAVFSYQLREQPTGRGGTVRYFQVRLQLGGRNLKLIDLNASDADTAHNLVAGLEQAQSGDRAAAVETLKETIECTPPATNRETLMVLALIFLPLFVFWIKGAF